MSIIRTGLPILVELIDLMNSVLMLSLQCFPASEFCEWVEV